MKKKKKTGNFTCLGFFCLGSFVFVCFVSSALRCLTMIFIFFSDKCLEQFAGIESVLNTFYGMNWERRTITTLITIAFEIKSLLQKSIEGRDEKSYIQLNNS